MNPVHVEHWIEEFIKAHARTSPDEIYGWLVGHEMADGELTIVSVITCERYITQNVIAARPDPHEIQELASALPQGIGFIGIYHSHPDQVFHSSTDDETAISLSKMYPKIISAVTNGNVIKWYRHLGGSKLSEFEPDRILDSNRRLQLIRAEANVDYRIFIEPNTPIIPQVSSALLDGFRGAWQDASIEFCQVLARGPNEDIMPFPSDLAKEKDSQNLKVVKNIAVKELPSKNLKFADERAILARTNISISGSEKERERKTLIIQGTLTIDGIVGAIAGTIDAAVYARQLESELLDDLMVKASRAVLGKCIGNGDTLIPPRTFYMPYLAIPLKIRVQVATSDPLVIARERETVKAMIKRATGMVTSGRVALGNIMLSSLLTIATLLNDQDLVARCKTMLDLGKKSELEKK